MLKSSQAGIERSGLTVSKVRSRFHAPMMAVSVLASSLFYSTFASALGLGEITLHSALNQPLNAEIALLETDGLGPEDIIARLASPEAFAKAGVERVFFLNDLRFTPVMRGGRGVIRVVSNKPVTEPYLSFLVQVARPNGDLLHEYTVLLDPATSPAGVAATRSRNAQGSPQSAVPESRMPVAPPPAVQGKHYTVVGGDTLNAIAGRLTGSGSKVPASQMADGIRALNPQAFAQGASSGLKPGQDLLLPDSAVLPTTTDPGTNAATPQTQGQAQPAQMRETAEQMTAAAIQTQQLTKALDELKAQTQDLQEQLVGKDKQIIALRTDLAQAQSTVRPVAAQPAPAATPVAPVQPPAPVAASVSEPFVSVPVLLGGLLILLLLLAFAYNRRRQQRSQTATPAATPDDSLIKPAQAAILPVFEVPAVAAQPVNTPAPTPSKAPASQRMAGAAPDALDGVSIYIAYGRFSEAIGILRNALEKQPDREDIRIRLLELLAEQGDSAGFALEEQAALEHNVTPQAIQDIRERYPQLKAREAQRAAAVVPAAALGAMSLDKSDAAPAADVLSETSQPAITELDETTAAALNPEPSDEFQLNLDDLSMDADWDLVDPFDAPPTRSKPAAAVVAAPEIDPGFSSDLNQLPEVFELSDEQFLSDFSEEDSVEPIEVIPPSGTDDLSDDFLDSFMNDDSEFDLLDLDEAPLSQINQAQVLIDDGDIESARKILQQVIAESDEDHQRLAREMLAGIS